jgi:hypothetical protein
MKMFPAGGWDVDEFEDPGDWVKEMKTLEATKSLREIMVSFKELSTVITKVTEPEELEEEGESEVDDADPSASPVKEERSAGTIYVSGGKSKKFVAQNPKVRLVFSIFFVLYLQFFSVFDAPMTRKTACIRRVSFPTRGVSTALGSIIRAVSTSNRLLSQHLSPRPRPLVLVVRSRLLNPLLPRRSLQNVPNLFLSLVRSPAD